MQHFESEEAALEYAMQELIATLEDDLLNMETSERPQHSDEDRSEMRRRIADLKTIQPKVTLAPSSEAAA